MKPGSMYVYLASVYLFLAAIPAAYAHEFWIEPVRFGVETGDNILADIRVGQYFKGDSQVFDPHRFETFTVTGPDGTRPVTGRLGDLPAVNVPTARGGLHVLAYRSTPSSITYADFSRLENFAIKEGVEWVLDAHRQRGLPDRDITEAYTRFVKTLVRVGDGAGSDQAVGFPLELIAETNPYTERTGDIRVRLLWRGSAYPAKQISFFQRLTGCQASRTVLFTDADGRASIPRGAGGRFLVNAVHAMEPTARTLTRINAVWESLWASLTYELPETVDADDAGCVATGDQDDR